MTVLDLTKDTVDTTVSEDRKAFIAKVSAIEKGQSLEFKAAIDTLPKINGALGIGKTNVRVLKVLKQTGLLSTTKTSMASLTIADKIAFAGKKLSSDWNIFSK